MCASKTPKKTELAGRMYRDYLKKEHAKIVAAQEKRLAAAKQARRERIKKGIDIRIPGVKL